MCKKSKKINIVVKKVTGSEVTLTYKEERPSNNIFSCFPHHQAEQSVSKFC